MENPIIRSRALHLLASGLFGFLLLGCAAAASAIVTNPKPRITDFNQVQVIFAPPTEPYEVVGTISSDGYLGPTKQRQMDRAVQKMKEKAAEIGANAVILQSQGTQAGGNVGTFIPSAGGGGIVAGGTTRFETVSGIAIFIKR